MEQKIHEFEEYIISLTVALRVNSNLKEDISNELRQDLYDKYNELLIKGYNPDQSVLNTLSRFEDPIQLARMFNSVYNKSYCFRNAMKVIYNKKTVIAAMLAILLMFLII